MQKNISVPPIQKIVSADELPGIADCAREMNLVIVTTNGSYDLLHAGHVRSLWWSSWQGDLLIVGINSDASVRAYKGTDRPIIPQDDRAYQVASVACVDYVCLFDEEEVGGALVRAVRPHTHTTGYNWVDGQGIVPEQEVIDEFEVKLRIVPQFSDDDGLSYSTTDIIRKIREVNHPRPKP